MTINYDRAIATRKVRPSISYGWEDTSFYALSLGFGMRPFDERALDHVLETRGPSVVPTMASTLIPSLSQEIGLDIGGLLHAEQRLVVHSPLPPAAEIETVSVVDSIVDKGKDKGAIITFSSHARLKTDGSDLFTITNVVFARRDGGCGGPATPAAPRPHSPDRAPDISHTIETRPESALLFRLNGDFNPLHADPAAARRSGFDRPILHGLASYGMAARAIIEALEIDGSAIRSFDVRFTAPVFPGETITTDIWRDGKDIAFRSRIAERDVVILDGGRCTLFA